MNEIEQILGDYLNNIIYITFGFNPIIETEMLEDRKVKIVLDGEDSHRALMMGKGAENLHAIKAMVRIYSKRYGYQVHLYIKDNRNEKRKSLDALELGEETIVQMREGKF